MMLYRSLVLGMLGAIALLVASPRPPAVVEATPVAAYAEPGESLSVIDVSRERSRDDLLPLLGLTPGERIVGIGSIAATSTDLVTRWRYTSAEKYLDIAVRGADGEMRRILVLAHP